MKKAVILFIIIFMLSALIPAYVFSENKEKEENELVTLFSSEIILQEQYSRPLPQ